MRQQTEDCYNELVEHVSNVDEQLGEIFLQEKTPTKEELKGGLCIINNNIAYW